MGKNLWITKCRFIKSEIAQGFKSLPQTPTPVFAANLFNSHENEGIVQYNEKVKAFNEQTLNTEDK